eukprot:9522688-Lingulodinium_polyedra.AAC.1
MGIVAHQTGPPVSILESAARAAFWTLPQNALARLANDLGLERSGSDLVSLVADLVQGILSPSAEELQQILQLRA